MLAEFASRTCLSSLRVCVRKKLDFSWSAVNLVTSRTVLVELASLALVLSQINCPCLSGSTLNVLILHCFILIFGCELTAEWSMKIFVSFSYDVDSKSPDLSKHVSFVGHLALFHCWTL